MIELKRSNFLIKPFLKRNNIRALYQIFSTLIPIISIWFVVYQIVNHPFLLIVKKYDLLFGKQLTKLKLLELW